MFDWIKRLRAWWDEIMDPLNWDTEWQESERETVWPEITEPSKLEHRP